MRVVHFLIALAAYLVVLVQVGALAAWSPFGAQPHLIALGAALFLLGGRLDLGLVWMLAGGGLYDLLLPVRFGWTLLPMFASYGLLLLGLRRFFDAPSWLGTMVLGLLLLVGTELPLIIRFGLWSHLLADVALGALLLAPVAALVVRRLELGGRGLVVR